MDSPVNDIRTSLLLTSDLKGTLEDPGYYFKDNSEQRKQALDNLLLTQGWVGYNWKDVLTDKPAKPEYQAEREYTIRGRVVNGFNGPIKEAKLNLLSAKPLFTQTAVTDSEGAYLFSGMFPTDSSRYIIQAKKKKGSPSVSLEANEFKQPVFEARVYPAIPWYVNSDTLMVRGAAANILMQQTYDKMNFGGKVLKEVKINDKKSIPDSKNLNGPGNADFVLDEEELQKQRQKSLREVMEEKFQKKFKMAAGFESDIYYFNEHYIVLFIDGIPGPYDPYMDGLYAEQIKGIEVMYTPNYALAYEPLFVNILNHKRNPHEVPVFIEVTTFTGMTNIIKTPNLLVYNPIPFTTPKEFYRPKYTIANVNAHPGTDLRSTIHWEPNVVTDKDGKATVTFYTSDRPANYTIVMEGSDMNGHIGSVTQKLTSNERAKTP